LVDHVAWNANHNTQVVQVAIAAGSALTGFQIGASSNSMGHLAADQRRYLVPTTSLDQCVELAGLAIPDLVKMDIEGAEAEALRGAAGILQERRTAWYISLHGEDARRSNRSQLRAAGFSVSDLAGNLLPEGLFGYPGDEIVGLPPGVGIWNSP
jgi:FkbM family methyltransferase